MRSGAWEGSARLFRIAEPTRTFESEFLNLLHDRCRSPGFPSITESVAILRGDPISTTVDSVAEREHAAFAYVASAAIGRIDAGEQPRSAIDDACAAARPLFADVVRWNDLCDLITLYLTTIRERSL